MEWTLAREEDALSCALDIGEAMLGAGAEIYRVEDTIGRVCRAYGLERVDTFAIPNTLLVTVRAPSGRAFTQTRRLHESSINLGLVNRLNQLSRDICRAPLPPEEVRARLAAETAPRRERPIVRVLAYIACTAGFSLFFGSSWGDALASACGALIILASQTWLRRARVNHILACVFCAAAAAACAFFFVRLGVAQHVDRIVIGDIMLLIPGVELTNSMRDMMAGDIIAALMHLFEALFIAVGIAVGAAGILALLGGVIG